MSRQRSVGDGGGREGGSEGGRERGRNNGVYYMYMYIPGGHSSGGRSLTAKVRGPWFNPGWLPVFHSSLKNIPKPFLTYIYMTLIGMHELHGRMHPN